jgi:hypothetical protein
LNSVEHSTYSQSSIAPPKSRGFLPRPHRARGTKTGAISHVFVFLLNQETSIQYSFAINKDRTG